MFGGNNYPIVATIGTVTPTITGTTPGSRCGAGSVILSAVSNPTTGPTINWYAIPTGGTYISTGTSYTTSSSSTVTETYYVDASLNGCTTATRTSVVATINSCRIGSVDNSDSNSEMVETTEIAPNPSQDNFNLTVHSSVNKLVEIIVIDVNGQTVQTGQTNTNEPFVFGNDYGAGMYAVKVVKDGKVETYKVVKIK